MTMTARRAPRGLAVAALAAAALALTSCASTPVGAGTSDGETPDAIPIDIQLSYIMNMEFAGEYVAVEEGFFEEAGISEVTLSPGGSAGVSAEARVAEGSAYIGTSSPLLTAPAIQQGAEIKTIAATYQINPFDIISAADAPLDGPEDMIGKTIAVHDFNTLAWEAFLAANGIGADEVDTVPFSDGPAQLASGQVDGYLGYGIGFTGTAGTTGIEVVHFLMHDHGLPMVGETIIASQETIDEDRERLKDVLVALIKGWRIAVDDNEYAADLTVNTYGADLALDYDDQLDTLGRQNDYIENEDSLENGLLYITEEQAEETVAGLNGAGIELEVDDVFDLSLIEEVYAENPDLR